MRTMLRRFRNVNPDNIINMKRMGNCEIVPIEVSKNLCKQCGKHFYEQDEDTLDTFGQVVRAVVDAHHDRNVRAIAHF